MLLLATQRQNTISFDLHDCVVSCRRKAVTEVWNHMSMASSVIRPERRYIATVGVATPRARSAKRALKLLVCLPRPYRSTALMPKSSYSRVLGFGSAVCACVCDGCRQIGVKKATWIDTTFKCRVVDRARALSPQLGAFFY